ncbi:response regulator [Chiayiivirga flava]|uniref:DNA-binding response OmpR family regulator n=1 Tax=Chiayiivirga flava TaxID=659595 RepID=A0A7W8D2B4_9GAMM|nr:response regulator [Chiayiivirga flava]MBB5206534.1 DNA-binding response OmpR family regulator [Chiayiivirga flava]
MAPPSDRPTVLVVDDDTEIVALLQRYLAGNGFHVRTAGSGAGLREQIAGEAVDLVLLDLGLPDEDGLSVLRHLQTAWRGPVIVVTGRGDAVERVVGLELGADDYVTKPFDFRELLARIRSVLRRAARPEASAGDGQRIGFAGFSLNLSTRSLVDASGAALPLTSGEFDLLAALLEDAGKVVDRDRLMTRLHGRDAGPYDRSIDVGIARLRRKLGDDAASPTLIRSVRGVGYLFAADVRRL